MMGQIREESVGFLFNLDVEVSGGGESTTVQARGLDPASSQAAALSYSAPSADAAGEVEVRNERGQVERAATAGAQKRQAQQPAPQQPQQAQKPQGGERGAFGQRAESTDDGPLNRSQRRAQEKRKK
jgi:preprotein translocase subunit SecA